MIRTLLTYPLRLLPLALLLGASTLYAQGGGDTVHSDAPASGLSSSQPAPLPNTGAPQGDGTLPSSMPSTLPSSGTASVTNGGAPASSVPAGGMGDRVPTAAPVDPVAPPQTNGTASSDLPSNGLNPAPPSTASGDPALLPSTGTVPPPRVVPLPTQDSATASQRAAAVTGGGDSIYSILDLDHPRLRPEEYTWAGSPRYTLTGDMPYRESHISGGTIAAYGGALLGLAGLITLYQQAWYPDSTQGPFNFKEDWTYSKQVDKGGHMLGGYISSYCSYEAFVACGLSPKDAALWGALGGLFFQTTIEVQDGFHTNYGFDWTDEVGNAIGAGYFYLQQQIPFLQNFEPKWGFTVTNPRDSAREAAQQHTRLIVDDYDRQDAWLSVRVRNLLNLDWWPRGVQIAFGAGARDVELNGYTPYRVVHIALDWNIKGLLSDFGINDLGSFGNWLVQGLNNFKLLPAPALRIWPDVRFELIYPYHF